MPWLPEINEYHSFSTIKYWLELTEGWFSLSRTHCHLCDGAVVGIEVASDVAIVVVGEAIVLCSANCRVQRSFHGWRAGVSVGIL